MARRHFFDKLTVPDENDKAGWAYFGEDVKTYKRAEENWKKANAKCCSLVLQHCSKDFKERLKSLSDCDKVREDQDVISLLKLVRDITHNDNETKQGTMAIVNLDLVRLQTSLCAW